MNRGSRESFLSIRLSDEERERIEQAAEKLGLPASTWIRSLALDTAAFAAAGREGVTVSELAPTAFDGMVE